jgi:L-asparagine transporter-like permease
MVMQAGATKIPLWANALRLIPTLVWILCVALLLVYKPDGYQAIVEAFIFAFVLLAVIWVFSARKARASKLKNEKNDQ